LEHSGNTASRMLSVTATSTRGMISFSISVAVALASSSYPNSIVRNTSWSTSPKNPEVVVHPGGDAGLLDGSDGEAAGEVLGTSDEVDGDKGEVVGGIVLADVGRGVGDGIGTAVEYISDMMSVVMWSQIGRCQMMM